MKDTCWRHWSFGRPKISFYRGNNYQIQKLNYAENNSHLERNINKYSAYLVSMRREQLNVNNHPPVDYTDYDLRRTASGGVNWRG